MFLGRKIICCIVMMWMHLILLQNGQNALTTTAKTSLGPNINTSLLYGSLEKGLKNKPN